jgi:hypothetical protein
MSKLEWYVSTDERNYLRELAKKQLEYSMLPIMKERQKNWYKHNDLKGDIPMIHFETWTCENDLLPESKCTSEAAKRIELQINRDVLNHERIGDDRVVPSFQTIGWDIDFTLFNLKVDLKHSSDSQGRDLGHQFIHPVRNLHEDLHLLKPTYYAVDREKTLKWKAFTEEVIGDILPVKFGMGSPAISLSQHIVHLMGMETMIFTLVDYPDDFHEIMRRMTDDYKNFLMWMEKEKLLFLNNGSNEIAQGTFGFTHDLPQKDSSSEKGIKVKDLWGYLDSQETVSISPEMYGEFFFPYYLQSAKQFGLVNYGCCEPVHSIWEEYIGKLPNLRKISISPWCDEEYMGEALRGRNTIYHRKPSPNFVGVTTELDEEAFSRHIMKTIRCAQGCKLEFSFRDVYILGGNPEKPRRAVQIVRELLERYWKQ